VDARDTLRDWQLLQPRAGGRPIYDDFGIKMISEALYSLLAQENIARLDSSEIVRYNHNPRTADCYKLRTGLGPCAFEGDIDAARIVLLLANPGFDTTSTQDDHSFRRDGWPLAGLHPEAPVGLRDWWHKRLRGLIATVGAQAVSQCVAALQITPWASNEFDSGLCLPSRRVILSAASSLAKRNAILIIMRAERLWLASNAVDKSLNRFRVKSWRCSYVSEGNLGREAWRQMVSTIEA
jgi:hypothetical protein